MRVWITAATLTILLSGPLAGCMTTNPIAAPAIAAQTPAQKAFALYGTFTTIEEQAANVMRDPTVALSLKKAIKIADSKAKPSADALLKGLLDYEKIAGEVRAGTATADSLTLAAENLGTWTTTAEQDIATLVAVVKPPSN